jgi:hypothetical protein
VSRQVLSRRFTLLKHFNRRARALIPLIDFSPLFNGNDAERSGSLAALVVSLKSLLFYDLKLELLSDHLVATQSSLRRPVITLNRQTPPCEPLFVQGFRQLHFVDPMRLRQNDRAWEVRFENEGANDAGGPYRESFTLFCADLTQAAERMPQSEPPVSGPTASPTAQPSPPPLLVSAALETGAPLRLLIRCPNYWSGYGDNRDAFLPNPSATSLREIQMFEFLGKLMGIALRTKEVVVDIDFPSLIWKSLLAIKPDRSDLAAIDLSCVNALEVIEGTSTTTHERLTPQNFNEFIFESFTTRTTDGRIVELKPGGKYIPVTWKNRREYVALVESYRLREFRLQVEAMLRGLRAIVPSHLLALFTWRELQQRVCGRPEIDINFLKQHTQYLGGLSPHDRHVQDFWRALESFSEEERSLFLRFVWGRSRLPSSSEFMRRFIFRLKPFAKFLHPPANLATNNNNTGQTSSIMPQPQQFVTSEVKSSNLRPSNPDDYLPEAQTCFCTLSLPPYSSYEVMRSKLLYAITTCREIDTDFIAHFSALGSSVSSASSLMNASHSSVTEDLSYFSDEEGFGNDIDRSTSPSCEIQ